MSEALATFDDRLTMRHRRTYPHPIERVWAAVTDEEQVARWMLPVAKIEPVEGGRCSFTWGGDVEQVGVVRDVLPPHTICFDLDTSSLRFELTSVDGGAATQVDLVHSFVAGAHVEPVDRPGGDQPGGAASPWRPDFVHGFHLMLDALGLVVDGELAEGDDLLSWVERARPQDLTDVYRQHIRATCPTPLATFVDRHTMVYERVYQHPITLVFDAVSTGEHLDAWMLPTSRVERRLGGACSFTWGGPADSPDVVPGVISVWEPPRVVEYLHDDGSWMRFDLTAEGDDATRMRFTLHFLPAPGAADDDFSGGDYPVPGTAWQPGFLAGFHEMVDQLGSFLAGTWTLEDNLRGLEAFVGDGPSDEHERLIVEYRAHVLATCPPPS